MHVCTLSEARDGVAAGIQRGLFSNVEGCCHGCQGSIRRVKKASQVDLKPEIFDRLRIQTDSNGFKSVAFDALELANQAQLASVGWITPSAARACTKVATCNCGMAMTQPCRA